MMVGIPDPIEPPVVSIDTVTTYIPRLRDYLKDRQHKKIYALAEKQMKQKLNYGYWLDEYEHAFSLAVAHFICITDPVFAQAASNDSTAGGVQSSRNIGGISYQYDTGKTMSDNPAYHYWNQTGYGRQLVALANSRGYLGMIINY